MKYKIPVDYIKREDRIPRAERRCDDDGAVLICITLFGLFGVVVGAVLMAWYLL